MEDDIDVFPSVARVTDAMLQKVDPANLVLVEYLKTVNPSIETDKLLKKFNEGPSKKRRGSKKDAQLSPLKASLVENLAKSPKKVVIGEKPSKKIQIL